MEVLAIDHVQLAMPKGREAEARRFYAETLRIPEIAKPPHLAARGGCWFERSKLKIHLGVEENFKPAKKAHLALLVANIEALSSRLSERGYSIAEDLPLEGYKRVYAQDPFGNRLELMERLSSDESS